MNLEHEVKQKKLTRFLCQELMYEYVRGALDEKRARQMDEYIAGCRDSQRELERLKRGLEYTARAAQTRVSPALREALLNFEPHWQKQLRAWTLWSSQRGWRFLPYIFVLLTIGTGLWVFKPWQPTVRDDMILAEQLKAEPDMVAPSTVPQISPTETPEQKAADAGKASPEMPAVAAEQPSVPPIAAVKVDTRLAQQDHAAAAGPLDLNLAKSASVTAPVMPTATATAMAPTPPVPTVVAPKAKVVSEDSSDDRTPVPATARGFIMRGDVGVADFSNSWPAIRDKILALGGKVAGNVELGWLRRPDQSYFHFSLPESNFSELELFLGTFGPVRFVKERNPRVMPEGQIRIILTVKDAITNEGTPETP